MTLSPEVEKAIDEAASHVYATAVAVHESMAAGRGATGYREAEVQGYLRTLAETVAREAAKFAIGAAIQVMHDSAPTPNPIDLEAAIRALLPGEEGK